MSRLNFNESRNPMLKEKVFEQTGIEAGLENAQRMTIDGAVTKTTYLFGIMLLTAAISWQMPSTLLMIAGVIGGLIAWFVAIFKKHTSPIAAPIFAAFEGLVVGSISAIYSSFMSGIVLQAIMLTMGTLFVMLFIYRTRIIKVTEKFKAGVVMATGAIFLVYLATWILSFFGINMPFIHEGGPIGIGISVVIIAVAALNLLLDFDMIEMGERYGSPKYMEWFTGMSLLFTLIWLYMEFLRLLAILQGD